nr:hypothetical protein [Tanacetum cinerariifolium]
MIVEMEAMDDPFEYADSLGCLKDIKRILGWKIMGLNQRIEDTEGEIRTFEGHLDIMDAIINSEQAQVENGYAMYVGQGMGAFLENLMNLRTRLGIGRVDLQYLWMLYRFRLHY